MNQLARSALLTVLMMFVSAACRAEQSFEVKHGYADSNGVKIHYAESGSGPLVVMIHGFPDFWYGWREQMQGLADAYHVVAIDQRGYNLSDKPEGVENYDMQLLVADVAAVIRHLGEENATIIGHDWGGVVAWSIAFNMPEIVDKLVVLNLPHPNGIAQSMRESPQALAATTYAKIFREGSPDDPKIFFGGPMNAHTLSGWVKDEAARKLYVEAFQRSDFTAMLNIYKQNYPDIWSKDYIKPPTAPNIAISTLVFHGMNDPAVHSDGLNNLWDWIDKDLTIITIPGASHFVQQDASDFVTSNMRSWLDARRE
ncbi:MAG: pimeloyl-ACP methyl ester carboxylesterase [Cryomorphaceae bacterium]|jgi:pimeloyl-ACP methyl ester carboxylesterase